MVGGISGGAAPVGPGVRGGAGRGGPPPGHWAVRAHWRKLSPWRASCCPAGYDDFYCNPAAPLKRRPTRGARFSEKKGRDASTMKEKRDFQQQKFIFLDFKTFPSIDLIKIFR